MAFGRDPNPRESRAYAEALMTNVKNTAAASPEDRLRAVQAASEASQTKKGRQIGIVALSIHNGQGVDECAVGQWAPDSLSRMIKVAGSDRFLGKVAVRVFDSDDPHARKAFCRSSQDADIRYNKEGYQPRIDVASIESIERNVIGSAVGNGNVLASVLTAEPDLGEYWREVDALKSQQG
ncbi:MAG: hypothetical protein AAB914_01150 [Patescibacteria group bacterium]